ncbi:MAG: cell division protein ZapA [Bacteroidetes bacterium]|nr:cell division protein ZapA [Bacteroidota bacterium]
MNEKIIKTEIAGGVYTLKINDTDETNVLEAVNLINSKIEEFEKNFSIKDKKDVLCMVMLHLVAHLQKQAGTAEKELSHIKALFAEIEIMLKEHYKGIKDLENQ